MNTTNNELIEFAKDQCEIFPEDSYMGKYLRETLKMLQAESCEDAVSRKEIQQKINRLWNSNGDKDYCMETLRDFVTELPPVKPARKKGKWIKSNYENMSKHTVRQLYCSECGSIHHDKETGKWREIFDFRYAYCPLCGAEMGSEE